MLSARFKRITTVRASRTAEAGNIVDWAICSDAPILAFLDNKLTANRVASWRANRFSPASKPTGGGWKMCLTPLRRAIARMRVADLLSDAAGQALKRFAAIEGV